MALSADARMGLARFGEPSPGDERAQISAARQEGRRLWISGQVAMAEGGMVASGVAGAESDVDVSRRCAHQCAVNRLDRIAETGGLDPDSSVLRLSVYVASTPEFRSQHLVADAATDVIAAVLSGPPHVRTAFGVACLPLGSPVEIDAVVLLKDGVEMS